MAMLLAALCPVCTQAQSVKEQLKAKYGYALDHTSGGRKWYSVKTDGKEGACDEGGRELLAPAFDNVTVDYEDRYIKAKQGKKTSIYDLNGKLVISTPYEDVRWYQMKDGYCEVSQGGLWGVMDRNGTLVVTCEFDGVSTYGIKEFGFCEVKKGKLAGAYDVANKQVVVPCEFDGVSAFMLKEYGYCSVKRNGKEGLYEPAGQQLIVPCEYDAVSTYQVTERGWTEVEKGKGTGKKVGVYDIRKKQETVACVYDLVKTNEEEMTRRGFFRVIRDGHYGVATSQLTEAVPCQYDYIESLSADDTHYFVVAKGGKRPADEAPARLHALSRPKGSLCGVVDLEGRELVPFIYDMIYVFGDVAVGYKGCTVELEAVQTINDYDDNQKAYKAYDLSCSTEKARCGFHNLKTGSSVECRFKDYSIGGGYVACQNASGKWGFLDAETMQEAVPFEYESASAFKDGVAQVRKNGKATFITDPNRGTSLRLANGGAAIKVDANIPETAAKQEESFAFIIANENYVHLKGADYAINDGKVFKDYCLKTFGLPESNVRYYEDATYGNMVNAVKKIKDIAEVYEGDANVIVYFSGLGATHAASRQRYLLPTDASVATLNVTGYSVGLLMDELGALNTRQTIVILDAPFSGLDKEGKPLAEARGAAIAPKPAAPQGNTLLVMADGGDGAAYSAKEYGHSLFTYALLDKIQDTKGKCTLKEALDHATSWTKKESLKRAGKAQTPATTPSEAMAGKMKDLKF